MVAQGRLKEAERALGRAERTLRTEADPAAGMRLRYGRGMLEFVSGRHDATLRAFQSAERLSASLRAPHTLAPRLRSHLLQTLTRAGETRRVEQVLADMDGPDLGRGEIRIAEASLRPRARSARSPPQARHRAHPTDRGDPEPAGPGGHGGMASPRSGGSWWVDSPAPEIADEMYLSVNTVKTHMRHLYDKLGARRRHEAVEQARALGLLAPSPRRP
jgi:hypothetical protein